MLYLLPNILATTKNDPIIIPIEVMDSNSPYCSDPEFKTVFTRTGRRTVNPAHSSIFQKKSIDKTAMSCLFLKIVFNADFVLFT